MTKGMADPIVEYIMDLIEDEGAVVLNQAQLDAINKDRGLTLEGRHIALVNTRGQLLLLQIDSAEAKIVGQLLPYVEPPYDYDAFNMESGIYQTVLELMEEF